jgi:hypothetical protein
MSSASSSETEKSGTLIKLRRENPKMSRRLLNIAACFALVLASAAVTFAQTEPKPVEPKPVTQPATQPGTTTQPATPATQTTVTTKKTEAVQNPDGTWTVIEYPTGKEVIVEFTPGPDLTNSKGKAKVIRVGEQTMVNVDLSGLPAEVKTFNVFAIDPFGKATLLGPVKITDGVATSEFKTNLNRFMLVLSPETIETYTPTTVVSMRSNLPEGFAVIPLSSSDREDGAAVGEKVAAVSTPGTTSTFGAPMLNVPGMKKGEDTEIKVKFAGALSGTRANISIEPRKDGPTSIIARFHELKESPAGEVYVLWAVGPDNSFVKLGQIVNTGTRNEAEIKSETTLPDFGLLVTLEKEVGKSPAGTIVGTFEP